MANLYPAEENPQLPGNAIWFQQDVDHPPAGRKRIRIFLGHLLIVRDPESGERPYNKRSPGPQPRLVIMNPVVPGRPNECAVLIREL
ncbi:hypothetical protein NQ318_005255 [Aromia moschata]|uniref:Uncharacterized protein n=1 Tax=Aromia moschata TaxID=1265417 RepID=A0AAV8Y1H8_9CUCU|nr:hypothetical protein NQ318_005255 [Aromia moschata]